ncbi:hypothetical protein J3F84DRAFT_156240 [Trichoderma pleuroticola]
MSFRHWTFGLSAVPANCAFPSPHRWTTCNKTKSCALWVHAHYNLTIQLLKIKKGKKGDSPGALSTSIRCFFFLSFTCFLSGQFFPFNIFYYQIRRNGLTAHDALQRFGIELRDYMILILFSLLLSARSFFSLSSFFLVFFSSFPQQRHTGHNIGSCFTGIVVEGKPEQHGTARHGTHGGVTAAPGGIVAHWRQAGWQNSSVGSTVKEKPWTWADGFGGHGAEWAWLKLYQAEGRLRKGGYSV